MKATADLMANVDLLGRTRIRLGVSPRLFDKNAAPKAWLKAWAELDMTQMTITGIGPISTTYLDTNQDFLSAFDEVFKEKTNRQKAPKPTGKFPKAERSSR